MNRPKKEASINEEVKEGSLDCDEGVQNFDEEDKGTEE